MYKKNLAVNTIVSIVYQIIVIICGFILPRAILGNFGSEINGLVNSITQFLSIVSLMELGVGAVVSSSLYGPLAEKKWKKVSEIVSAAEKFFGRIAKILLVYVVGLVIIYPFINNSGFDAVYTGSLIFIISINSFAQYYIGVVDNIILGADQRAFIVYGTQAITTLLNTVLCIIIMQFDVGIHIVKLVTSSVYLIRPILVRLYLKRKYNINRKQTYEVEPLKQKWNAVAQHVSECVLDSTDIMILTVFSTLLNVSIYYVYNLVVYNLKNFFLISASSGVLSILGELYATNNENELKKFFDKTEWVVHTLVVFLFGVTEVLIIPFVTVYTNHITDANYIQPLFAFFIVLAHASHCIRLPYFLMIKAAGHYQQTQNCFVISTIANIIISIILVKKFGLIGVAIGTLVAMTYQTCRLACYAYRTLLGKDLIKFLKRIGIDAVIFILICGTGSFFRLSKVSYISWILLAIKIVFSAGVVVLLVELAFDRSKVVNLIRKNMKRRID